MSTQLADSEPTAKKPTPSSFTPSHIALVATWILTTGTLAVMLFYGARYTDQYNGVLYLLPAVYVASLLWYLARTGPAPDQLPEVRSPVLPRWEFGSWIPALAVALVFLGTVFSDDGEDIMALLLIAATVCILVVWWREIRLRHIVQGLGLGAVAYLAGRPAMTNGLLTEVALYLLAGLTPLMYVAGGLLIRRTRLGGVQLLEGQYAKSLGSLLWGCLLFIPLGLLNTAEGSPGSGFTWVNEWWMPLFYPWFSAIAEETWFRLMLVGLCYFLLRPALRENPTAAVVAAVVLGGVMFGLAHGRTFERFLTTGLLYGVSMAAVFARRDFEHAVGAHYMVNIIPWAAVFLEN